MKLDAYLTEKGISQAEFGKKLSPPVSQGLVSQWINGGTRVTLDNALEIERVTDGAVTVRDCSEMFQKAAA